MVRKHAPFCTEAALEDHRPLADIELDAVTGGMIQFAAVRGNSNGSGLLTSALDAWNELLKTYGYKD